MAACLASCLILKSLVVRRFESDNVTHLKCSATEGQSDSPTEKESDVRTESPSKSLPIGAEQAEEQFEWGEVIRGLKCPEPLIVQ